MAVDPVQRIFIKRARRQECDQCVGEEQIRIRRDNELAASSTDADVFGDVLEERDYIGVAEPLMRLGRNADEADREGLGLCSNLEYLMKPRTWGRIPLHNDQFTC
jgi:hypothetical protein